MEPARPARWQAGARADRDLDAVVGLFDAAQRYVDRLPAAGPDAFLEHIQGQDVPGDTLAARAQSGDGVALLTPAGAAGREWRFVAVSGVQEGVWPDLRLRGSLLGSEELVAVVTGRDRTFRAAQTAVRYDETRLFLVAVSRASERLLVTAVRSEDDQPSVYLDLVDPLVAAGESTNDAPEQREFTEPGPNAVAAVAGRRPPSPAAAVRLRREPGRRGRRGRCVSGPDAGAAAAAATALARLAAAGVDGADPRQWWVQCVLSDDRLAATPGPAGPALPSKVEKPLATAGSAGPRRARR